MLSRDNIIWLVLDIMACYDCHIREIGSLILRSNRINEDRIKNLIKNLEAMNTYVQTQFRVSKEGYKSKREDVHYGTG